MARAAHRGDREAWWAVLKQPDAVARLASLLRASPPSAAVLRVEQAFGIGAQAWPGRWRRTLARVLSEQAPSGWLDVVRGERATGRRRAHFGAPSKCAPRWPPGCVTTSTSGSTSCTSAS